MISVAVVGCGIVGSGVVQMLTGNQSIISNSANTQIRLSHVVDVRPMDLPMGVQYTHDFGEVMADKSVRIVVESIGGTGAAYEFTKRALLTGRHVVTSNKALVATHGEELLALARKYGVRYLFEASVGGGIPILRPIHECLTGDKLTQIDGIVNGSTNYILTRMEQASISFSEALKEAQLRGYAEANPDADIDGADARRKLLILANAAFGAALMGDAYINATGIRRITHRDIAIASAMDRRIKLIVHGEANEGGWLGWVAPALVAKNHSFFTVNDVENAICVHGDFVGDVVFQGQGAGSRPTASAIVADIVYIARHMNDVYFPSKPGSKPGFFAAEAPSYRWAARIEGADSENLEKSAFDVIPGSKVMVSQDIMALITPKLTETQYLAAEKRLAELNIHMGLGLRFFE